MNWRERADSELGTTRNTGAERWCGRVGSVMLAGWLSSSWVQASQTLEVTGSGSLGWRVELPAWLWVILAMVCMSVARWSYRRLMGSNVVRWVLTGVRAAVLMLIVMLLCGPQWVIPRERIEADTVLVLVDRSASLAVEDHGPIAVTNPNADETEMVRNDDAGKSWISRDEALKSALRNQLAVWGEDGLGKQRLVKWIGFDERWYPIAEAQAMEQWPRAEGSSSRWRSALEATLADQRSELVSGVVLISDGRSQEKADAELLAQLRAQGLKVFTIKLGGERGEGVDVSIAEVDGPSKAFAQDAVPLTVRVDRYPADAQLAAGQVNVRLVDEVSGNVLDEQPVAEWMREIRLTGRSDQLGEQRWKVEAVVSGGQGQMTADWVMENNQREVRLTIVDEPIRVLYVEGYPRWEYRYLKSLLVREKSIESSVMLASADASFAQEGNTPIARLPRSSEEFKPYDVIVIGDLAAGYFSDAQLEMIREQVAVRGSGLLWLTGASQVNPRSYAGGPLAELLPIRQPAEVDRLALGSSGLMLMPTALARGLAVMQLSSGLDRQAISSAGWPMDLPLLRWAQDIGPLKPTAEVLAYGSTAEQSAQWPLVVRMRYGAGQILYVATDDSWRWRLGQGELYFEQYWVQLIRMLSRQRLDQQGDQSVSLSVSQPRVEVGDVVKLRLRVEDEQWQSRQRAQVNLVGRLLDKTDETGAQEQRVVEENLVLTRVEPEQDVQINRVDPLRETTGVVYETNWQTTRAGNWQWQLNEAGFTAEDAMVRLEVIADDDEKRQVATDHALLETLASQTGGQGLELSEMGRLVELMPNRALRTPDDIRRSLVETYSLWLLVIGLLSAEWIGRKMIRLA